MNQETKNCQNCRQPFVIEPEDFQFYEKIDVPPPTFCFDCRLQRRMAWRNERSLYKRRCDAPGHTEDIISMYAPGTPYKAVDTKYWWSDAWDPLASGLEYDFSRPFFAQFAELTKRVPLLALSLINSVNSDYTNYVDGNKNCYLIFGGGWSENVSYSNKIMSIKDSQDLLGCNHCELSYECVNCVKSYRLRFGDNCETCTDARFLYDCRNCQNCVGCANLVNKSYCIGNVQYAKEEYAAKLAELRLDTAVGIRAARERFYREVYPRALRRYANIFNSTNCTGENINNSKNCRYCFDSYENAEDNKYMYSLLTTKDCYDGIGIFKNPLGYETVDTNVGQNNHMSITIYASNDVSYSWNCHSSSNLFGCIGLRSRNYCILNKQYSKEEYLALVPKIIRHMNGQPYTDGKGRVHRYGEFFPVETCPLAYNETIAQEYFPLSRDEIEARGFAWRDTVDRNYVPTMRVDDLPPGADIPNSIVNDIIECPHKGTCHEQCTTAFRVTAADLRFHRAMNLPLPRLCPNCRHYERLRQRNPLKLWHRACQCVGAGSSNGVYCNTVSHQHGAEKCPNEFETSYAPDRPETVYCEKCYQAEVV